MKVQAPKLAPVDVTAYVRECLDGVTGDVTAPTRFTFADWDGPRTKGLTPEQHAVYTQIVAALVGRFGRALTQNEDVALGMALVLEWNRRAHVDAMAKGGV